MVRLDLHVNSNMVYWIIEQTIEDLCSVIDNTFNHDNSKFLTSWLVIIDLMDAIFHKRIEFLFVGLFWVDIEVTNAFDLHNIDPLTVPRLNFCFLQKQ